MRNRDDLLAALARVTVDVDDARIGYRGQYREYELHRHPAICQALYGDAEAREPSLLPSSARRTIDFDAALVEWCSLLNLYLAEAPRHVTNSPLARDIRDEAEHLANSMNLYLYALALAQHYGLPSNGLDVTDDLDVALFFALSTFEETGDHGVLRHRRRHSGEPAVLYVFAIPSRFYFEFERHGPIDALALRPLRQTARFLHAGWGFSKNASARFLRAALYLDPTGDFGELPPSSGLFPGTTEDFFAEWLISAVRELGESPIKSLVGGSLYWVVE